MSIENTFNKDSLIRRGFILRENEEKYNVWKIYGTDYEIVSFPKDKSYYFIYLIKEPITGYFYIGMKRVPPKTIGWKKYIGSSNSWKAFVYSNDSKKLEKYVLLICTSKYTARYYEIKYIMKYGGIENNLMFNRNIMGKFFHKKVFTGEIDIFHD